MIVVVAVVLVAAVASGFMLSRWETGARAASTRHAGSAQLPTDGIPSTERVVSVPLADRVPARLPVEGVPSGWHVKEFAGRANVELVRDDMLALRLRSDRSSFVLYRDIQVDVQSHPWLSWSWKVVRLPSGADVRAPN